MADKFTLNYLNGIQEHVYKEYSKLPGRFRLAGMDKDLDEGQMRAIVYFNAAIVVLNHMGALKDDVMDDILPNIEQRINNSVWEE